MKKIIAALGVALVLALPTPASAHHLFDGDSGFAASRNNQHNNPIKLWKPDSWGLNLNYVKTQWNNKANWDMFTITPNESGADVKFAPTGGAGGAWAECYLANGTLTYTDPFDNCKVFMTNHSDTDGTRLTAQHELGHTLGFADHIYGADYPGGYVNPRVCHPQGHPQYSNYVGIMSACTWLDGLTVDDRTMLENASYK